MDSNFLKTQHLKSGIFHFLRMEVLGTIIICSFIMLGFIAPDILSKNPQPSLIIFPALLFLLCFYGVFFAFLRARFLRKGGYCVITPEVIKAVCDGKTTIYEYKGRSITTRKRKGGTKDIYIGRSPIHLFKFGFGKKYFRTLIVCLGLCAPLYNVVNADEVLEYLKHHK